MRALVLGVAMLLPLAAQAAEESVVSIEPSGNAGWRLTCAWEGVTAVDRRGTGPQVFRFPPGRLNCVVAMTNRGGLRVEAVGASGGRSTTTLIGGGRSRFSLR